MGQVTTCFRSLEVTESRRDHPVAHIKSEELFEVCFEAVGDDGCSTDSDVGEVISEDGDWSDDDDASSNWSSDDCDADPIAKDLWNSFSCGAIPYANEYVEHQISIANVRVANEKSARTYITSIQVEHSGTLKKVKFLAEPNLVTVIS